MTAPLVYPDLHVGIPTLTGDPTVPVSRRTQALIAGSAVETVTVPVTGVPAGVPVRVSLNGCVTWAATVSVAGAVNFAVAGAQVPVPGTAWVLPPHTQTWVWLSIITGGDVQIRKAAQPIVTSGVTSDLPGSIRTIIGAASLTPDPANPGLYLLGA